MNSRLVVSQGSSDVVRKENVSRGVMSDESRGRVLSLAQASKVAKRGRHRILIEIEHTIG